MSIQKQLKTLIYTALMATLLFWGCESTLNTETGSGTGSMLVKLHDAPVDYDEVNISVKQVEVNNTETDSGWVVISEPNETYNILDLVNGDMAVLADVELEVGTYEQIRLILNDENTVVIDGVTNKLIVPSGEQSGLKLNINAEIKEGIEYTLLLDFDANKSVVKRGNQDVYNLKPVIRATNEAVTGNITGTIQPANARAAVYAIQGSETLSTTYADTVSGEFTLVGLEAGSYTVSAAPREAGFETEAVDSVSVLVDDTIDIGEIELTASGTE